jgi:ATP-dependent Clp protease ATP-binding subunit ClpX
LRCSFCRRREAEVDKLVAGPRVYICDRCVAIAVDLMAGSPDQPSSPPHRPLVQRIIELGRPGWFRKACQSTAG